MIVCKNFPLRFEAALDVMMPLQAQHNRNEMVMIVTKIDQFALVHTHKMRQ